MKTNEKVLEKLSDCRLFIIQDSLELFDGYGLNTGVTVGDVGLKLISKLGAKNIYLIGLDASYDMQNGYSHDNFYKNDMISFDKSNQHNLLKVKGNTMEFVYTNDLYLDMIKSVSKTIKDCGVTVYNGSNGAFFDGSITVDYNHNGFDFTFASFDKSFVLNILYDLMHKNSKRTFTVFDVNMIKLNIEFLSKQQLGVLKVGKCDTIACQILASYLDFILPYLSPVTENTINKQFNYLVDYMTKFLIDARSEI